MIYKVFYQETKERSPRRETTRALYLDIDASSELEGRIAARQLVEENRPEYNICLLYTSPSPRDRSVSRMPSSA